MSISRNLSIVGARAPRTDAPAKVTGSAVFSSDVVLPGMLHAKILTCPYAHARVKEINLDEAKKLPGVSVAISCFDVPDVPFATAGHPSEITPDDSYILSKKARFVGEPIAALAARTEAIAQEALKHIKVEYEQLPPVFDVFEAMKPGAPLVHGNCRDNLAGDYTTTVGSVDEGFESADLIVEDEYELQIVQHCTLETHGCVVSPEAGGRLKVWSSTQIPFTLRRILAKALEIHPSRINVIKPHVGGGFGAKQEVIQETICAFLAMRAGSPVRLFYSRKEDMISTRTRHSCVIRMKTGVKKDGTLTSRQMEMFTNCGAYSSHGPIVTIYAGVNWVPPYRCPNVKFVGKTVYTNLPVGGAFRGYGVPQAFYTNESHFDHVAQELGMDPLEFRLKNCSHPGDIDPMTQWSLRTCALEECLKKGAEEISWSQRQQIKETVKSSTPNRRRGFGLACYGYGSGAAPYAQETSSAMVKLNDDGSVTLSIGSADIGQGLETAFAQIVAEELGVRFSDVLVHELNTDFCPYDVGTYASRQTYVGGYAAKLAAADLKRQLFEIAAEILDVRPELLHASNGEISVSAQKEKGTTIGEVARRACYGRNPCQLIGKATWNAIGNAPSFGTHFAEVEVDLETGKVDVHKVVAVHDVGKVINLNSIEGQIEGGVAQGIGYALLEDLKYDSQTGEILNSNLRDYKLPTACDIPLITPIFIESDEPTGPFGAKCIGEPALIPCAGAIANAVCDALGIRIQSIPITQEKVVAALRNTHG